MVQHALADPAYVMGRTQAEAQRLILQSRLYEGITRRFLADAGLAPGMTVLDVGSGAGDVAFAVADLVGPSGRVVGIDVNSAVLETARARAHAERRDNVSFTTGDCRTAILPDDFDAAVGRLVLMYTGDATATLRAVVDRVKPGGVVAFAEADFTSVLGYLRAGPGGMNQTIWEWATRAFTDSGVPVDMAGPLYRAFIATGLGAPEMALHAPLGGGEGWCGFEWFAASARSVLPMLEQHGIATADDVNVETLATRSHAEVVETGIPLMLMSLVTAWARKPV